MFATVRALFEHIIDYAGVFPPARLPLPDALRHYAGYVTGPRQWLLGRLVCPAGRLAELTEAARAQSIASGLQVTVIGQGGADFLARLAEDVAAIEAFRRDWWPDVADVLELVVPAASDLPALMEHSLAITKPARLRTFFEFPAGADFGAQVAAACAALKNESGDAAGLKIRCGGATAEAFPSDETVAGFMARCRDARLPWKATAGLHHPLRQRDDHLGVLSHGFLNVFGAGVLSYGQPLTEGNLVEILRDREGAHFWFQNDRFGWKQWSCSLREIQERRRRWVASFGSCSVDEPYADLVALGMVSV